MSQRLPSRQLIEAVVFEEAEREGVTMLDVLGVSRVVKARRARNRAWLRLVLEERFPILGVAEAWGCERRGIQRALAVVRQP